ncbi:hypothetical protein ACFL7D_11350 [candidate division KSB1 bacterium]
MNIESKIAHLGYIQDVIKRMGSNSFLIKGWSVTLVSALFALYVNSSNVQFLTLAFIPALIFWGLDGYFLSIESTYRKHYDHVRIKNPEEIDFSMDIGYIQHGFNEWISITISKTLFPFHGSLIGIIAVIIFI